jgi:cobyrinic acid a,c-diamide synthase
MVLGYLQPDEASVTIQDRHLGLRTAIEKKHGELYDRLARSTASDTIDLERVDDSGPVCRCIPGRTSADRRERRQRQQPVRVGVAYDAAFCFYYRRQP